MVHRYDLQVERARFETLMGLHDTRMRPEPGYYGALNHFSKAEELYAALNYAERPPLELEVGLMHGNWATTLGLEKQFNTALERFATAFQYISSNSDCNNVVMMLQLGHLCANRASVLRRMGRANDAIASCEEAKLYYDAVAAQSPAMVVEGLAKLDCILGKSYRDAGRVSDAHAAITRSLLAFRSAELVNRRDLDMDRFRSYYAGIELLGNGFDSKWAANASQEISVHLELRQTFTPDGYAMLYLFKAFHFKWIQYASKEESLNDVLFALCAISGRRLSRQMLDEDEGYNAALRDPALEHLLHLRRRLTAGREAVSETFADAKDLIDQTLMRDLLHSIRKEQGLEETERPSYEDVFEKFDQLGGLRKVSLADVREYVDARSRLSDLAGSTVLNPFATFDAMALAGRLRPHEVLVCLLDLRLAASDEINDFDGQYALILMPNGQTKFIALNINLVDLINFTASSGAVRGNGRLRRGPQRLAQDKRNAEPLTWIEAAQRSSSELWEPIASALPEPISHVVVVTQGRFHVLPLELGKPDHLILSHYVNLSFFARSNPADTSPPAATHQILVNRDSSLTFANREAEPLLTQVWSTTPLPISIRIAETLDSVSQVTPVQYLHIAGHGNRRPDRHKHRNIAEVKLDVNNSLTEQMVFTKLPPAEIVWLSSCVVGLTEDDMEGDPVGMIIPFLIRGTHFVVASLTEVPDLWMPLLVSLTEWFRVVERQPLPRALSRAQSSLKLWVQNPTLKGFHKIYSDWLRATWRLWLVGEWGTGGTEPWSAATTDEFRLHLNQRLLREAIPDMGIEMSQATLAQLISSDGMSNASRIELLLDALTQASLVPPDEVCDVLTYAVRAFSGLRE